MPAAGSVCPTFALLLPSGSGPAERDVSSAAALGLLTADASSEALQFGLFLGMLSACVAICVCLWLKRRARLKRVLESSRTRNYTPYGESAGPEDATEMAGVIT